MSLPFLPFKKKEKPKYFLVLLLREEKVHAVILEEFAGKIKIASYRQDYFQDSIETAPIEEFLMVLDKAISTIETEISLEFPTHQVIFGVKENWIQDGKIKKPYLAKLKKVSDELGLTPIGFLVIPEAITHLMKHEEGVPISTLLVEAGKKTVHVSLIKANRLLETKNSPLEESYAHTVDTLLKLFTNAEILPSRVTLFNDDKNEEVLMQEFIGHTWSKSLPFLHVPQITTLPRDFAIRAVISASAQQMGFEILEDYIEEPIKEEDIAQIQTDVSISQQEEIKTEKEEISKNPISEKQQPKEEFKKDIEPEETGGQFGFVINDDITQKKEEEPPQEKTEKLISHQVAKIQPSTSLPKASLATIIKVIQKGVAIVAYIFDTFLTKIVKQIRIPQKLPQSRFIIVFGGVLIAIITVLLLYVFGLKANVLLEIKPKIIKQSQDVSFIHKSSSDFSKNSISGEFVSVSEEGSTTTQVTGKKEVGEKAKGSITIYSRFTQDKTFPAGTTVTSSNGVAFSSDDQIKLASASAGASATPVTTKANVTAKQIGKESNLPSGTKFSVSSFDISDIEAKNDSAFSGGSKKEITAVSKEDIEKLLTDLPKQLESKAKGDISKKISGDLELLPTFFKVSVTKKEINKNVGDEAGNATINGVVEYLGIAYKKEEFHRYALTLLQNRFPSDLTVWEDRIGKDIKTIRQKNDSEVLATIDLEALLIPKLDIEKITNQLSGKSFIDAQDLLLKLPQIEDVTIQLSPTFSFLPKNLPRTSKNIKIQTKIHD